MGDTPRGIVNPGDQDGRVALITGAAGGLGDALVGEFLNRGWRVAAGWYRRAPGRVHKDHSPVHLDVTSAASVDAAIAAVLSRWGRIDVLVNNAGVTADGSMARLTDEQWERVLAVNLRGAFLCSRAVAQAMVREREGQIINISSYSARYGHAGQANYAAAKAGLIGLTQSLAKELGGRQIRVNAVLPGVLATPMTAGLGEERLAALAADNALRRLNTTDEVARFIVFLTSMRNVSGQLFQLDSRVGRWT